MCEGESPRELQIGTLYKAAFADCSSYNASGVKFEDVQFAVASQLQSLKKATEQLYPACTVQLDCDDLASLHPGFEDGVRVTVADLKITEELVRHVDVTAYHCFLPQFETPEPIPAVELKFTLTDPYLTGGAST